MTPLGFIPLIDAITRCSEAWALSAPEAWAKLRPWLQAGRLDSCAIGESGQTFSAGSEWAAKRNDEALKTGTLLYPSLYDDALSEKLAFVSDDDLDALLAGRLPTSDARYRANTVTPEGYLSVRDAFTRCRDVWGGTFEEVWDRLLPLITLRQISTLEIDDNGTRFSDPDLCSAARNREAYIAGKLIFSLGGIDSRRDGYINQADLEQALSGTADRAGENTAAEAIVPGTNIAEGKTRGPKAGHDAFWLEACRLIFTGECSPDENTRTEFEQRLISWMRTNRPGLYTESTVETKVKNIWKVCKPRG